MFSLYDSGIMKERHFPTHWSFYKEVSHFGKSEMDFMYSKTSG